MGGRSTLRIFNTFSGPVRVSDVGGVLNSTDGVVTDSSYRPFHTRAQTSHMHDKILSVTKPLVSASLVALLLVGMFVSARLSRTRHQTVTGLPRHWLWRLHWQGLRRLHWRRRRQHVISHEHLSHASHTSQRTGCPRLRAAEGDDAVKWDGTGTTCHSLKTAQHAYFRLRC